MVEIEINGQTILRNNTKTRWHDALNRFRMDLIAQVAYYTRIDTADERKPEPRPMCDVFIRVKRPRRVHV